MPLAERGVVQHDDLVSARFSADGSRLYYTLTTPRRAGDVWAFDLGTGQATRLTDSPVSVPVAELVSPEVTSVASFDDEHVPLYVFRPRSGERRPPVVVVVHGGPEAQATLAFDPIVQGLVAAGYGVVVPNVRGSTGYGKRYASLDDTTRRLDSVRDLASVHGRLAQASASTLAAPPYGAVRTGVTWCWPAWPSSPSSGPPAWTSSVSPTWSLSWRTRRPTAGPTASTSTARLAEDRAFLATASPLRRADAIRAPLFVVHGRNDPRVPVSEAEQLAAKLKDRNIRCELLIYEDEGHGLARLSNRLDAFPRALAFLDEVLQHSAPEG